MQAAKNTSSASASPAMKALLAFSALSGWSNQALSKRTLRWLAG